MMKQVAFERNAKKLASKKPLGLNPTLQAQAPTVEQQIEAEFARERAKAARDFEKKFGADYKGIYGRWFYSDMELMHEGIKKKYYNLEKKKKNEILWEK